MQLGLATSTHGTICGSYCILFVTSGGTYDAARARSHARTRTHALARSAGKTPAQRSGGLPPIPGARTTRWTSSTGTPQGQHQALELRNAPPSSHCRRNNLHLHRHSHRDNRALLLHLVLAPHPLRRLYRHWRHRRMCTRTRTAGVTGCKLESTRPAQ